MTPHDGGKGQDMIKYAVSSYSFRRVMAEGRMTMLDVIPKAKEMGFAGVEIVPLGETMEEKRLLAPKLARQAEEYGIEIASYLVGNDFLLNGLEASLDALRQEAEIAAMLGAPRMRHDATAGKDADGNDVAWEVALPVLAEGYRRATEFAQTLGVKTMIENHGHYAQASTRVEQLVNTVDHSNFGWLCDIGNFICVDEDPLEAVKRAAKYAVHVHAKDFHLKSRDWPFPNAGWSKTLGGNYRRGAIIGHGNVPVAKSIDVLKKTGYSGWIAVEFEGLEDNFYGITEGFANLKSFVENEL